MCAGPRRLCVGSPLCRSCFLLRVLSYPLRFSRVSCGSFAVVGSFVQRGVWLFWFERLQKPVVEEKLKTRRGSHVVHECFPFSFVWSRVVSFWIDFFLFFFRPCFLRFFVEIVLVGYEASRLRFAADNSAILV